MDIFANNFRNVGGLLMVLTFFCSCDNAERNTGSHITEIDSAEDRQLIDPNYEETDVLEPNSSNSVRVNLDPDADFNWEDFKSEFQRQQEAIGGGYQDGDDKVYSSWQNFKGNYSYQTVYHYRENDLWIQTYYRDKEPTEEPEFRAIGDRKLLTKEEAQAQDSELKGLWEEMEETARKFPDQTL